MRHCRLWFQIFALLFTSACVSPISANFGVDKEYLAHIPARIAVLPCRPWPQGALFPGQEPTQITPATSTSLCEQIDKFVLQGFDGQPFMRGISPKVVKALLARDDQAVTLEALDGLWFRPGQACESCRHPSSYYREVIAPRTDWRAWLSSLSRSATNSDAILVPFIVGAQEAKVDDRGLFYARRAAQIALLLIDTNNGQLIWSGGREAEVRAPVAKGSETLKPEQYPAWEELWLRLFTEDLWREFPGRQT